MTKPILWAGNGQDWKGVETSTILAQCKLKLEDKCL